MAFMSANGYSSVYWMSKCAYQRTVRVARQLLRSFHDVTYDSSPLGGIRVVDLTRIVAGPFCTMILGDLGAEVIKVERPGSGDESRKWGPPFMKNSNESCYFMAVNRNKKSICIDFQSASGKSILLDLVAQCDVLVENYVPGKLKSLGLSYEDLYASAPHLIYCSITGYGSKGPYSNRPGYDVIAASMGGLLHITGPIDGEPCKIGVAMTDMATGLYAHGAIMAALLQRYRTGRGQKIDCNLLSTQVSCLINIASNYLNAGEEAKRWGTAHPSLVPYESFPTADGGYLTICTGSDDQFKCLCAKLSLPELMSDDRFIANEWRVVNRNALIEILRKRFLEKTMDEWLTSFEGSPFPYGPVNNLSRVFSDPHICQIGLVNEVQHPTAGKVKVIGPPVCYSEGSNKVRLPPPLLGQHTDEILSHLLGYSKEQIDLLKIDGVIQ